jgi:DNA polymerase V
MEKPWIALLDCNNFFVSCERLFRPDLVGKPVVVLSGNDGCIVARSQEVKDMGVPMGVPYFQVKDMLKKTETTTFSSHFALYRDISRRVFTVMREELEVVHQYSVDEAFFQCAESDESLVYSVKMAVEKRVGIPVSIGVAPTKTLAKHANTYAKKGSGVHFLQMKEWSEAAKSVPLSSIWGVGGKLEMRYKQHGLLTVADLLAADTARIKQLFGVHGIRLQKELLGQSALLFDDVREPQKSIMSSRSFGKETTQASVVHDAVAYHVRHALEDLRSMRCKASVIRVSIRPSRHGDYVLRGGSKEAVFAVPTNNTIEVLKVAKELTESLFEAGVPYKKAGVVLAGFTSVDAAQQSLFADESTLKSDALMPVIDLLNKRLGKDAVTIGSHHKVSKWQALSELKSPSYTTRWSDVREVKT